MENLEFTVPLELDIIQKADGEYTTRPAGGSRKVTGAPVYVGSLFYVMDERRKVILAYVNHDGASSDHNELLKAEDAAFEELAVQFPDFRVAWECPHYEM